MSSPRVPCSQQDFLEQDPSIRGQNYVCLSFLSPEEVIKRKEAFFLEKFYETLSKDLNTLFADLKVRYPKDLDGINYTMDQYRHFFQPSEMSSKLQEFINGATDLEKQYFEENNFQTSIRGIKVRGVYDTLREAQKRCETLKASDSLHNIYIAQVGCWCPWAPNPDEIQDQEYGETALNTMMKKYNDNQLTKDAFYEQRKNELKEVAASKNAATAEAPQDQPASSEVSVEELAITSEDPWMRRKEADN